MGKLHKDLKKGLKEIIAYKKGLCWKIQLTQLKELP